MPPLGPLLAVTEDPVPIVVARLPFLSIVPETVELVDGYGITAATAPYSTKLYDLFVYPMLLLRLFEALIWIRLFD